VPDHTTIWRFRRLLGEAMDELLAESVRLGKEAGLPSLGRARIDGTKLPSAASQWARFRKASEEADGELTQSLESDTPAADSPVAETPRIEKPEGEDTGTNDAQEAATRIILGLKKPKKKPERLPPKDPDARPMKTRQGHYILGYNAQVLIDRDTELVMALHVCNEASDARLLEPTLEKYLDLHRELPSDLLADAGYDTPNNAQVIDDLGIDACVSCKERKLFWRLDGQNRPICPMGHAALYKDKFTKDVPVIRFVVHECPDCPLRSTCLAKESSKHKTITVEARADVANWIRQRHKAKSEEGKARLKERGSSIEFGFARMKERLHFRRLSMWGLQGARTEVGIVALAMNLAILGSQANLEDLAKLLAALVMACYASIAASGRCLRPSLESRWHSLQNPDLIYRPPSASAPYRRGNAKRRLLRERGR